MEVVFIFIPLILLAAYMSHKRLKIEEREIALKEKRFNLYSLRCKQKLEQQ